MRSVPMVWAMNESVTPNTPGLIRLARAELEAAKAKHCQHGVPQTACRDHHAAATDDTPGGDK